MLPAVWTSSVSPRRLARRLWDTFLASFAFGRDAVLWVWGPRTGTPAAATLQTSLPKCRRVKASGVGHYQRNSKPKLVP